MGRAPGSLRVVWLSRSGLVPAGLALLAWLACTAPAPYVIAPGQEGAPGVRRVLLCPMNVALALPSEIAEGAAPVQREIVAYLEARDLQVERLGLRSARQRWRAAAVEAKQQGATQAATLFVQGLAKQHEFDALVMPSLISYAVRVTDNRGSWDGVSRRMAMVNVPRQGGVRATDTFSKGVALGGVTGDVPVTSLHVMVFSRDGERLFEGRGGLDYVHEIDLEGARETYRYHLRRKPHLLEEPEIVREGIEIAFDPYLPPPTGR